MRWPVDEKGFFVCCSQMTKITVNVQIQAEINGRSSYPLTIINAIIAWGCCPFCGIFLRDDLNPNPI